MAEYGSFQTGPESQIVALAEFFIAMLEKAPRGGLQK